jgi:hypothetical protein
MLPTNEPSVLLELERLFTRDIPAKITDECNPFHLPVLDFFVDHWSLVKNQASGLEKARGRR